MFCSRWFTVLLLTSVLSASVPADGSDRAVAPSASSAGCASSRLSAEMRLSRYATYYAASFSVRELGRQMTTVIERRAKNHDVSLTSLMDPADRRTVQRLESLQGDDFDMAYMSLLSAWAISCERLE